MNDGLEPSCSDLGQNVEHVLLDWLGRKANRRGIVAMEYDLLVERIGREVFRSGHGQHKAGEALRHLFDAGYIEKLHAGDSIRFRMVGECACQNFSVEDYSDQSGAAARGASLALTRWTGPEDPSGASRDEDPGGVASQRLIKVIRERRPAEKMATPYMELARRFFPELLRQQGVVHALAVNDYRAFAHQLRVWHDRDGLSYTMMRRMMEEFAQRPQWYTRSRSMPWKVFVSKAGALQELVLGQSKRDPSNRSLTQTREYWFGGHTSGASLPV